MNPLVAFFAEIFTRIFTKSPLFFKIWTWVSTAALAVSGLPSLLQTLGVTLSPSLTVLESKTLTIAASVALFMSLMTTQGTVKKNGTGIITTDTDPKKLPFTTQVQQKQIDAKK